MRNMKKRVVFFAVMAGVLVCFAGCKKDGGTATEAGAAAKTKATMLVTAEQKLQITYQEAFDKEHYKEEELRAAVTKELQEFNTSISNEQGAVMDSLTVADGNASLKITFADFDTYTKYANAYVDAESDVKVFVGTASEASAAGYDIPASLKDKDGNAVTKDTVELTDDCIVIYTNEAQKLYVDGDCKYYSESVQVKDGLATVEEGKDNYLIYQKKK
jgi:hypothetical protein